MTAPTHITFAEFMYLLLLTTTGVALSAVNATTVAIASVLADIDTESSFVGALVPRLPGLIERRFGHRTLTHSLLFVGALVLVSFPLTLVSRDVYVCFLAGYATHPFVDSMTVHGVHLFYPFSHVKCVFPFDAGHPYRYRADSGGKMDRGLGIAFLICSVPTFLIANEGYERFIRFTQKNVESAIRDYNEYSRTHLVDVDLRAHNLLSKEQIAGRFEAVGTVNESVMLFRSDDGRLHSLGNEYQAEYAVEWAVCRKGDPCSVTTQLIDMGGRTIAGVYDRLPAHPGQRFFGVLTTHEPVIVPQQVQQFSPITASAGTMRLSYATYQDIAALGLEHAPISSGLLTIRTVLPSVQPHRADTTIASRTSISVETDPKDLIEIVAREGEKMFTGDILMKRRSLLEWEIRLVAEKAAVLRTEYDEKRQVLTDRLAVAVEKVRMDSLDHMHTGLLRERRFAVGTAEEETSMKLSRSRYALRAAVASLRTLKAAYALRMRKLQNDNVALRSRALLGRLSAAGVGDSTSSAEAGFVSVTKSPVTGIVAKIRREGRRVTFCIAKCGT